MKVLVTGGTGLVGRYVVRELLRRGHAVTAAGRTPGQVVDSARYAVLDCTDIDATRAMVREHEAVIHLAAIPAPQQGTSWDIFKINCLGTYHIYEACVAAGVRKLAVASSINALGQFFGVKLLPVRYFPIDEEHPHLSSDAYSFSKHVTEEIGEFFWQRNRLSSVCIRIPYVAEPTPAQAAKLQQYRENNPDNAFLVRNYWTWIDARDSARAFARGIEAEYEGAHNLFVNDKFNSLGLPSRELAARFYPEVTDWREPIAADEALVSCRRAREIIGWEPHYSWRGVAAGGPLPTDE